MVNMSYCRFENTLSDLMDCYDHMDDDDLSASETDARESMISMCKEIADMYSEKVEED